jgi:hypothetical protein
MQNTIYKIKICYFCLGTGRLGVSLSLGNTPPPPTKATLFEIGAEIFSLPRGAKYLNSPLALTSGLFPSCFQPKTLYTPLLFSIRVTYPAHLILFYVIT